MQDYTQDFLLNKQVKILQPVNGYRASTDAVILSSVIKIVKPGDNILDVGSGTGAISLCLAERFKNQQPLITGLEIQKDLTELANLSAKTNKFDSFLNFINCNIKNKIPGIQNCSFQHVISNPPYSESDMPSPNKSKATAHNHSGFDLNSWIRFCIKMVKPKGFFYMINRAENIDKILSSISGKLGAVKIIPIYSKANQEAKRVIIIAQKDSKAPTQILQPFIVHDNNGDYTEKAKTILRDGKGYF